MNITVGKYILHGSIAMSLVVSGVTLFNNFESKDAIKIGVMTSLTGDMASRERVLVNATELAVEEINNNGGLLGRKVELVILDGASDPKSFAKAAEHLILIDKVEAVFGCWTSSCRKSVLPVFEKYNHLLYYPAQYEGLENSKNIIYLGSVPNQQMIPALEWSFSKFGKKVYLLGSDYVYPRAANQFIKDKIVQMRGEVVAERYIKLGGDDFSTVVEEIKRLKPDAIFNTIDGVSNLHFFKSLRSSGIRSRDIPTFSFSISETEVADFKDIDMNGDFVVLSYLQGLTNPKNRDFIKSYQQKFGKDTSPDQIIASVYLGVHLWAKSVLEAGSSRVDRVRAFASEKSVHGPSGMVYIEGETQHAWQQMHLAQIGEARVLKSVWRSNAPIPPIPYPVTRSRFQWQEYLQDLRQGWGGHWQAP
jgi:urea transport system substrate-binding protein